MAVAGARLLGASVILAVDSVPRRLELAKEYGADVAINIKECDPVEEIMKLTHGVGVDSAIEAVGFQEAFESCVKVTCPGGTIANIGYHGEGDYVKIPRLEWGLGMGEKTIRTGLCPGGTLRMRRLLALVQNGRVDPTKLSTHHFRFEEVARALEIMETKHEDGVIKPVIHFE